MRLTRMSSTEPEPLRQPAAEPEPLPSQTTTTVLERELVEERQLSEPGDHERFAHYVRKEKILESALTGDPVVALCGKVWLPSRNPDRFPVCPVCKEIHQNLRPGRGDDGEGDN
ncbi:MAG: DUF3039 domain-containing protein [Actinomycetales bacterium]